MDIQAVGTIHRALPLFLALSSPPTTKEAEYVTIKSVLASREPIETRLREIWCMVLELDEIGPEEDFFELGGDSLAAVQVLAEIKREFGYDLPVASLLGNCLAGQSVCTGISDNLRLCNSQRFRHR